MAYKNELQLALSGKETASKRIAIIDSTTFTDETAERFGKRRREQYQKLLEKSEERITEIKSRIAEDISAKKLQLEGFRKEKTHINTRYQLGEISSEEREKGENRLRKKFVTIQWPHKMSKIGTKNLKL